MVVYDTVHAEIQGRTAMRDEIVADLDKRIAILSESIASGKHWPAHKIALQVAQRVLQVAREDNAQRK